MEPVTHLLTGACLARAGCNRRAAYATATMVIAAQFPDIDTLWSLRGPVESFAHHRGITHTFLGLPFEAALLVAGVYGVHRWRLRRRSAERRVSPLRPASSGQDERVGAKPLTKAPVRWAELYGFALLALLSHLLLDFTNNYGLRPFFPFHPQWYAASIVFIFDPLIFALLVAALVLPSLFGLVSSEVGAKRQMFRGRGLAIAALLGIVALWMFREVEHNRAVDLAMGQTFAYVPESAVATPQDVAATPQSAADNPENAVAAQNPDSVLPDVPPMNLQAQRVLASPDPLNPFHWSVTMDFGPVYQLAEVDVRNGSVTPDETTYPKPTRSPAVLAAEASPLGRAYLDWSSMPIVTEGTGAADDAEGPLPGAARTVMFRDPRFMGGADWLQDLLHLGGRTPLTGQVTLDASGHVMRQSMDGRAER